MKITVEISKENVRGEDVYEVCVFFDEEGAEFLAGKIASLKQGGVIEHEHLMTPSWSGWELSEERQHPSSILCNHFELHFVPNSDTRSGSMN
jgi:hypothetical protein